ncbi:MAG: 2'-5' RNA ligase family protein [Flavobacteriales bacterium]|nr:2'-5' RNA ligase family protein [Flavobacteriales bacterium]
MLHRFLLTILPSTDLSEKVMALRAALFARIGSFSGRNTPPHITLCFLDLPEAMEPQVVGAVASGTVGLQAFMLHYKGITHFPDKRTIFIDPVEKEAIAAVRTPIICALKADEVLAGAVRETDHPHLTLAAGLKPDKFHAAWGMLAPHGLQHQERVGGVVLLKGPLQPGTIYGPVRKFPLG